MAWDSSSFDSTTGVMTMIWNQGKLDTFSYSAVTVPTDQTSVSSYVVAANAAQQQFNVQYQANLIAQQNAASIAAATLTQAQNN